MKLRKPKSKSVARIEVVEVARRWWQRREVRLRCSCGWESPQTWPARPMVELAFVDRMTQRTFAELHFDSREHTDRENGGRDD